MSLYPRVAAALTACLIAFPAAAENLPAKPRQVVIVSFDGANDIAQWQRSRSLAAVTGARFTYFLSCVFLLTRDTRGLYQAPGEKAGRSNVGFAPSTSDVAARLDQIRLARNEGHEIASHGCGHFDGAKWSAADWRREFASFSTILRDAWRINGLAGEPQGWRHFAETEVKGFRAPYLSTGRHLDQALAEAGFAYDASGVSRGPAEPVRKGGLLAFALPQIPEGPAGRKVIAMDYNLYVRHSGGFERGDETGAFEERTVKALLAAFDKEYRGDRTPLQVGFHFTLMNGGAYWRALERFARDVCTRPDVDCISYADFVARQTEKDKPAGGVGG
ncbi:polysaccharide deacetylase family protein [Kumtagia ephedrae]|uniref:Polysaccharide deacetylase n=1 Tax=Kumtagia ephedrae TaxID=2116701 RepID=A0A2P7SJC7_9HYPH|nr:polysaccharide deacetylase family protein [Mesorhizobium ephedrae]PSJ62583.1 polysaccharide deacetylase [Mesorhizobium ephedrae]